MPIHSSSDQSLHDEIMRLLISLEASGQSILIRKDKDLLQSIVDAAAQIFGAAAASIALVDDLQQKIVFQVAYGVGKENVIGVAIPLDQGLAGYVVMTGQPISVSDVQRDARFNQDFAASTGYVPRSILATPLLYEDRVIGVMEVLDKINAPSFGMQDMDLLGVFARQAAISICQSQQYDRLDAALVGGLRRLIAGTDSSQLCQALDEVEAEGVEENLLAIADQFNALSRLGNKEQQACLEILRAFGRYAQARFKLY